MLLKTLLNFITALPLIMNVHGNYGKIVSPCSI